MSDVGYTDTPYGRCPIKSIRTLATPLITPLVQEFRHLSSSSAFENSVLLFSFPFPILGFGGRNSNRGGEGIGLSGRSVRGWSGP